MGSSLSLPPAYEPEILQCFFTDCCDAIQPVKQLRNLGTVLGPSFPYLVCSIGQAVLWIFLRNSS